MKHHSAIALIISLVIAITGCSKKAPQKTDSDLSQPTDTTIVTADTNTNEEQGDIIKEDNGDIFKFSITTGEIKAQNANDKNPQPPEVIKITIHVDSVNNSYPVKYDMDCEGDGEFEYTDLKDEQNCVYPSNSGMHQIWLRGEIPSVHLCDTDDRDNRNSTAVISVDSWGNNHWKSMSQFAKDCEALIQIPKLAPNLNEVSDMSKMFYGARKFNQSVESWDVSNVKYMSYMFSCANTFNQPLEKLNVSNVIHMDGMFSEASASTYHSEFNQPLSNWNVSNVKDMNNMFNGAISFNQPLENWNVSNVTDMREMFCDARSFNQPLENWNVSNVTNMIGMFEHADAFNQPLEKWDVSKVNNMASMFAHAIEFNQPLENWNVSNVTSMREMFSNANKFNQPLNNWNVSNVTNMREMFTFATAFDQPLDKWNISNVMDLKDMFNSASSFSHYPKDWDICTYLHYDIFSGTQIDEQLQDDIKISKNCTKALSCDVVPTTSSVTKTDTPWGYIQKTEWEMGDILTVYDKIPVFTEKTEANQKINNALAEVHNQFVNKFKEAWKLSCGLDPEEEDQHRYTLDAEVKDLGKEIRVDFDYQWYMGATTEDKENSYRFDKATGARLKN